MMQRPRLGLEQESFPIDAQGAPWFESARHNQKAALAWWHRQVGPHQRVLTQKSMSVSGAWLLHMSKLPRLIHGSFGVFCTDWLGGLRG